MIKHCIPGVPHHRFSGWLTRSKQPMNLSMAALANHSIPPTIKEKSNHHGFAPDLDTTLHLASHSGETKPIATERLLREQGDTRHGW